MAEGDELRINASLDGDLADSLRAIEQRLASVERALGSAGAAGKSAGDSIEEGATGAAAAMDRAERSAKTAAAAFAAARTGSKRAADALRDQGAAAESAARATDDAASSSRTAAAAFAAARTASERQATALRDTERAAQRAGRAVSDAGDDAAESGAEAAVAASGWERLTRSIRQNERAASAYNRASALLNSAHLAGQRALDRVSSSWTRFNGLDWGGAAKKVDGLAKKMGGFSRILKVAKMGLMAIAGVSLIGFLSSMVAGLTAAIGSLGGLSKAIGAFLPVAVAAKLAMLAWKVAAEAVAPQLDSIKAKFAGLGEAVAKGGLKAGLQSLSNDLGGFVKVTTVGFGQIGQALGQGATQLGQIAKNGERLSEVSRIFTGVQSILQSLIGTILNVGQAFVAILDAAMPVSTQMAKDTQNLSKAMLTWVDAANKSGQLTQIIREGYEQLKRTIKTLTDFAVGLFHIFQIGARQAGWMGDSIEKAAGQFRTWTSSAEGQVSVAKWFADSMPIFKEFLYLIRDVIKGLGGLATSAGLQPMIEQLRTELLPAVLEVLKKLSSQGGLLPAIFDGFTQVAHMFTSLDLSGLTMLAQMFAQVAAWIANTIQAVPGLATLISALATFYVVGGGALKLIAWGIGIWKAFQVGILAVRTAMWMTSLLAPGFWAALTGPVGLIVIAIMAIVGVIIYLWNNCEWFRDAVKAVWAAIVTAAKAAGDFFVWLGGIFAGVWQAIVSAAETAWNNFLWPIFSTIFTVIKWIAAILFTILVVPFVLAWKLLSLAAQAAWEFILKPVFDAIAAGLSWLNDNVVQPVLGWIAARWNDLMVGIQAAWAVTGAPVLDAISTALSWLNSNVIQPVLGFIRDSWTTLMSGISTGYNNYLAPVFAAFGDALSWLNTNIVQPVLGWIEQRWQDMAAGFQWVKQNIIDPVFGAIGTGLDTLKGWFDSAVSMIGNLWNGLKRLLADPINFLIEKVWNGGVLPVWNWVAGKLGLPEGQPVSPIAFARGGMVPGYAPGKDRVPAVLSPGEAVMRPEVARGMGSTWVDQVNLVARKAGPKGVASFLKYGGESIRQFADGGVVAKGQGWAMGEAGKPYGWGAVGPAAYDCSGFMSAITGVLTDANPHVRRFSTGSFSANRGAGGFMPGLGSAFSIGVNPSVDGGYGHMAGTLGGMNVESNGGDGVVTGMRALGADASLFPWKFSLPQVGGEFVSGGGGGWTWDIVKKVLDGMINPLISMIPFHGPPDWLDIPTHMATKARDEMYAWAQEKLEAVMSFFGGGQAGMGDAAVRTAVQQMAARFGWGDGAEWSSLDKLIQGESGWNPQAANSSSSARGLFQKMTSIHGPLEPSVAGQALWGLNYIKGSYGDPINAYGKWSSRSPHWYDEGGMLPTGLSMVMNGTGSPEPVFTAGQWDMLDPTQYIDAMHSTPQSFEARAVSARDDGLSAAVSSLAAAVAERPPAITADGENTRKAVLEALRQDRRERDLRDRYSYGR